MPRKVRDSALETRSARARLKVRKKPYLRMIEPGLHLGFRKLANGPGTWVVRRYHGNGVYTLKNLLTFDGELILADDYSDADGQKVLSFAQAQERARTFKANPRGGKYTVANAMDDYFAYLDSEGRGDHTISNAVCRDRAFIRPELGKIELTSLTTERLRKWRDKLASTPPRIRTKKGEAQKHGKIDGEDAMRARRASANRTWTVLRAALNHAFESDKIASDLAWRKIKPFKSVDTARVRYLTVTEANKLLDACQPDFRLLVEAALQTGARYSELARLTVADFNADVGTIAIRQSKSGVPRHIVLTDEGVAFFKGLATGRSGDEKMLLKADGTAWGFDHQVRRMADAVKAAKIKPPISFHGLRHTWASHAIMNGVPLMVVAKNLGHADTRMVEKHYGHLAPSYVADAVRAGAPKFNIAA